MYLFWLYRNLRVEAGLEGIFALHFTLFALRLVLTNNWSVFTDGCLEIVIRKRRVAVLEGVLECSQISYITTRMVFKVCTLSIEVNVVILNVFDVYKKSHDLHMNEYNNMAY